MPPTPDAMMVMVTEPQSGLRRFLGRFLAGTHGMYSAIARCRGSPEACEQGRRHGFRVFAPLAPRFAPKVVLLLIITVEEVFNCRSVHPKVNIIEYVDIQGYSKNRQKKKKK